MEYSRDFKTDLIIGQEGEKFVAGFFTEGCKVEVKTDFLAHRTGNVAIEYASRGKLSGIATTEADYWAIVLEGGYNKDFVIFISVSKLKEIARKYRKAGSEVLGGDDNTSKIVLIPIKELFNK
jgi:hypothetical protein